VWKLVAIAALAFSAPAMAQIYQPYGQQQQQQSQPYGYGTGSNPSAHQNQGYTTQQGTVVQPHMQTNPNNTQTDNFSSRGNFNPYTGNMGSRAPRY